VKCLTLATHVGGTPSCSANEQQSLSHLPSTILVAMLEAAHATANATHCETQENQRCLTQTNVELVQENIKLHHSLKAMECVIKGIHDISGSAISDFILKIE
jgi:hypothetical protein